MKKNYYIPVAVLVILLITNPSLKDFKEYMGISSSEIEYKTLQFAHRDHNYFVCSSYSVNGGSGSYFAVVGNFFYIKSERQISNEYLQTIYDTLSKKLELDTYDTFKEKLKDKIYQDSIYTEAVLTMHLDDYEEFKNRVKLATN